MSPQERLTVNNPIRDWFMRGEMAVFRRLADLPAGAAVLDMGCGRGTSVRLIFEKFRPARLVGFDIDAPLIGQACRRLAPLLDETVEVRVADATRLPFADAEFDAAFELGMLHHVPDWRAALGETARVLKPGGVFYFAEPSYGRIHRGLYCMMGHPKGAGFTADELHRALSDADLQTDGCFRRTPLWDIVGIARRASGGCDVRGRGETMP
jgi:ubiquinone/menaquinone biosynthesis C-methylase UbiE